MFIRATLDVPVPVASAIERLDAALARNRLDEVSDEAMPRAAHSPCRPCATRFVESSTARRPTGDRFGHSVGGPDAALDGENRLVLSVVKALLGRRLIPELLGVAVEIGGDEPPIRASLDPRVARPDEPDSGGRQR